MTTRIRYVRSLPPAAAVLAGVLLASTLSYGLSTEVAGVHGNFADGLGSNTQGTRAEQDFQRTNPQRSQRIRGLASASLTGGFFLTDIPFDAYNIDRTISAGARIRFCSERSFRNCRIRLAMSAPQ